MRKKSVLISILLLLVMLAAQVTIVQAAGDISVIVDGRALVSDPAPFIQNGRVLVGMSSIFDALGANVSWDASTQTVTAVKGDTTVTLVIGQTTASIGEDEKTLDVAPQIVDSRTVVPLRFVSEALGAQVNWDAGLDQVIINSAVTSTGGALPASSTSLSGNLLIDGSTSMQPLEEELKTAFVAQYPDVNITITGGGSGVGIADAAAGKVNIGASSAALTSSAPSNLVGTTICKDAIVIVINPSNPISKLTSKQVTAIFSGQVNNWGYLGGTSEQPIMVYTREAGSGTLTYFEQSFLGSTPLVSTAKQYDSTDLIKQAVASNPNAIGFVSMGYLDSTLKAPPLDGVIPSLATAKSGAYKYVRPFVMCTQGQPTGLAKDFIQFALSSAGQAIAAKDYLPL